MEIKADIAVIGAGSGGLTVAAGAAQMGAKVVLVEKGKMGGDCLNYGCVPSKALLAASHQARGADKRFGVSTKPVVDYATVNQHVKNVIAAIAPHDSVERFTGFGVEVVQGKAEFISRNAIKVDDKTISAKYFVVATGSSPLVPPIPGLDSCSYFTNETIFDNKQLPKHLLVIGGGPIGMEMAQAHRLLGAKVTVVDMGPILPRDNPDLVKIARKQFEEDGIEFNEFIKINKVSQKKDAGIVMKITTKDGENKDLFGSHLLVAAGRIANIKGLGLEKAGVDYHPRGIATNQRLQTSNRRIYAIGDVTSPYQFTHIATYHAGIVIRNILFKMCAKVNYRSIPWVTYTTPEMAHCGLTKQEALSKYGENNVRELEWSYEENDRAQAELATEGMMKLLVHKKGRLLGADIVGMNAGDIIQPWILAIEQNLKVGAMAGYISPYPTLGEVNKRVAGSFYTDKLFNNPGMKKLVSILMKLPF